LYKAGAPQALCDLVATCTAKNPAGRPQGFAPLCAELERLIAAADAAPTVAAAPRAPSVAAATQPVRTPARLATGPSPSAAASAAATAALKPPRPGWIIPAAIGAFIVIAAGIYFATRPKPVATSAAVPASAKSASAALAPTLSTSSGDMVLVPEGDFGFGENKAKVHLPAFYIDKTEVSNAAYAAFCSATGRPLPKDSPQDKPSLPVVNVSVLDAHQFANWAGKRLPTAKEWEKAARGEDGRAFPWGNEYDNARANVKGHAVEPVDSHSDGASPYGALNMVGNVWEYVEQLSVPSAAALENFRIRLDPAPRADEPWYQIRGQSFSDPLGQDVIWDSTTVPARWKDANIGFRCAKDTHQ
jgi:formylglycine-generating enzyme required for sulfatase activity